MLDEKTIFAPATAAGRGGVAVFRISGKEAIRAVNTMCTPERVPEARRATMRAIHHPVTKETIDRGLVLCFAAPHSFTGEDVVEFHTHGGRAVTQAMLEALGQLEGFRLAEPGEFTRRAFENGKMDLTEAEAIADLVDAETEAQRRQAVRQMEGALGTLYEGWRSRLVKSLAMMEAAIDFAEEELPEDLIDRQLEVLRDLRKEMTRHLDDNHRGERLRDGFSVVLAGTPNAGKSSLLNALARRDAAIVSPTAGTTRDVIEVHLDIKGYPVILADTAGLRRKEEEAEGHDKIEREGIKRALARAEAADLKLAIFDGVFWPSLDVGVMELIDDKCLVVVNKSDLVLDRGATQKIKDRDILFVSSHTGEGIENLIERLGQEIDRRYADVGAPSLTRARHREALQECVENLERIERNTQADLRAEDVRMAMRALGRITGRVDVEDLLDIIFSDFCLGK